MRGHKGIALLEVLVSVILLGFFLTAVYRPLLSSLNALNYAESYLEALHLTGNKVWEFREKIRETKKIPKDSRAEVLMGRRKAYQFLILVNGPIGKKFYEGKAFLTWTSGGREGKMTRVFYFTMP
ncbi:MAG TPA: hypothetical protein PKL97_07685 [Candidatus Omnitrophota bacterium]|nr:hypothetical protein [Candidatus Omnitrophota bacterium]